MRCIAAFMVGMTLFGLACGDDDGSMTGSDGGTTPGRDGSTPGRDGARPRSDGGPPTMPLDGPPAGNPDGTCAVPAEAEAVDTSSPDHVIGDGTPASCTSAAVVAAVAQGGIITFACGDDPITITLDATAKIFNDTGPQIVIDGGGKVTLSGGGTRRILYMDTCDQARTSRRRCARTRITRSSPCRT